jgi:hypothetical protein
MVIREWRGRASSSQADAYPKHFREKVIAELRGVAGFAGASVGASSKTRSSFWC